MTRRVRSRTIASDGLARLDRSCARVRALRRRSRAAASAQAASLSMVNGDPITTYDIEQRIQASSSSSPTRPSARQEVIDELIDEKLKIQIAKRYKLEIADKRSRQRLRRNGPAHAHDAAAAHRRSLAPGRASTPTRSRPASRADMVWQQIVRGKFQSSFQFRDKDVARRLAQSRKKDEKDAANVRLRIHAAADPVRRAERDRRGGIEARKTRGRGAARPVPELRRGPAVRARAARRRGARSDHQDLRRPRRRRCAKSSTRPAVGRLTDPEMTAAGRRGVRAVRQARDQGRRRRRSARSAKRCSPRQFQAKFEALPRRSCAPGDDRMNRGHK